MGNCGGCFGGGWVQLDAACSGCGGSGQGWSANPGEQAFCSGCGGSGRKLEMRPCPNCGGSGGAADGGGPAWAPPPVPLSRGKRVRYKLANLVGLGVMAAYVYYSTR